VVCIGRIDMAGNLATRQAGYSGAATVFATLNIPNACAPVTIKRSVWVGNPNIVKTVNGAVTSTASVSAGGLYNLAASSLSPSTTFNYNNYTGSGNIGVDIYSPNSPNTQMYVLANSTNGYRKVKLTATNNCGNYAEDFVFLLSSGMLKVFPNPATDLLTLDFGSTEVEESIPQEIQLIGETSTNPERVVFVREAIVQQRISISVGDLPRGTYYLYLLFGSDKNKRVEKIRIVLN
jgi:hypothetical protein